MADGMKKNLQVLRDQARAAWKQMRVDLADTWGRIKQAVDDGRHSRLGHLFTAALGNVVDAMLSLRRYWLYVLIVLLAMYPLSLTGWYQFPVSVRWVGF